MGATAALDDDARLIEGLKAGDEAAFRELVDSFGPMLLRLALAHVPSRAVAEEVVQETWLAVLNGIDRFEGRSALRTWITSILLNTARTRGERERRILPFTLLRRRAQEGAAEPAVPPERFQGRRGQQPGAWARPPAEWEDPQERLDGDAARQVMLDAIRVLPPRQRDVIVLRDVLGYSSDEVRNELDLSETNQRVLLHRARSKVRAALEKHLEGEEAAG